MKLVSHIVAGSAAILAVVFFVPAPARAVALIWDSDTTTGPTIEDGSGTWDNTNTNWSDTVVNTNWTSANPDSAIIGNGGTAGTISLGTNITAGNVTFGAVASGAYLIQSNVLTLSGPPTVTMNADATIASVLAGTGFTLGGAGRLTLTTNNTFSGNITINGGALQVGAGGASGAVPAPNISIGGGTSLIEFRGDTTELTITNSLSGSGTLVAMGSGVSNAGQYVFSGSNNLFSGSIVVTNARVHSGGTANFGTASVAVQDGGQVYLTAGTFTQPLSIAGKGWSETSGTLGALRLEANAGWSGPITLAGNARIGVYLSNTVGTISGPVSGNNELELWAGNGVGTLQIQPSSLNQYGSLRVGGTVIALANNANAFNANPVVFDGGTLRVNGNNFSFTNISSTANGGHLQNASATTAARVTLGLDNNNQTFGGTMENNVNNDMAGGGTLGVTKVGTGSLTVGNNGANGSMIVGQGSLVVTGSWSGPLVLSNGTVAVAQGGSGLLGQYYNLTSPNPYPQFATVQGMNLVFATNNPNVLFSSSALGANFDFGTANCQFMPPGYNNGGNNVINLQVRWTGKYNAPVAGVYSFTTASDDGSMLIIDGTNIVNNNFNQGVVARSNFFGLAAGPHDIVIGYYQGGGGLGFNYSNTVPNTYTGLLQNALLSSGPGIGGLSGDAGTTLFVSNGLLTIAQSSAGVFSGTIDGNGGLVKIGTAALTLNGNQTYTDVTTIASGTLIANNNLGSGLVTVQNAGTLAGTGTIANVVATQDGALINPATAGTAGIITFANLLAETSGTTNVIDITTITNDIIAVPGTLAPNSAYFGVNAQQALTNGSYLVGTYGTLTGRFNSTVRNLNVATGGIKRLSLDYSVPNQIRLTIADSAALKWSGAVNGIWDVSTTTNWVNSGTSLPDVFNSGDNVIFDDSAVGNFNISTFQSLEPLSITANNSANAYVITGAYPVASTLGITKNGTNSLTLGLPGSTYLGAINVNSGRLVVAANQTLGLSTSITVAVGAQLNFNGNPDTNLNSRFTVGGSGPDGSGVLISTNTSIAALAGISNLTLTADSVLGTYGAVATDQGRFDLCLGGTLNAQNFQVTKLGNGLLDIRGTAVNFTNLIINTGVAFGESVNNSLGSNVVVNSGAQVGAFGGVQNGCTITLNTNATLTSMGGAASTWNGTIIALGATNTIKQQANYAGYSGSDIIINGRITGPSAIMFGNTNFTTYLRGSNNYSGATLLPNALGSRVVLSNATGFCVTTPTIQIGNLTNGGGNAILETGLNNQFAPSVASLKFGGSPGDWTYLKLMGTIQYVNQIVSDDNGGGILENCESEAGLASDGVLNIIGSADSYWSGSYIRDRNNGVAGAGKLRINKAGTGTLTLATENSPSSNFTGGIIVSNGVLNLKSRWAAGYGPITMAGGTLALDGFGVQEGFLGGIASIQLTNANPVNTAVKLTSTRANVGSNVAADFGGNTTWIYTGYLIVTNPTPVTWTFGENIDDNGYIKIDSTVVLNDGSWSNPTIGTITLSPGLHTFDARAYNGGGGEGAQTTAWWTTPQMAFGYDPLGRNQQVMTNYQLVADPGDGSFLQCDVTVTNAITLQANTPLRVSTAVGPTNTITGIISGASYGITKIGAGILALSGANSYGGSTTVSNGTLLVNGTQSGGGGVTVVSNAALWGAGTLSLASITAQSGSIIGPRRGMATNGTLTAYSLSLNTGATIDLLLQGTNPTVRTSGAGALTLGASNQVQVVSVAPYALGSYAVLGYNTPFSGSISNLYLNPMPNGACGFFSNNIANSTVDLVITNTGGGIKWIGSIDNWWNIAATANWQTIPGGLQTIFNLNDSVIFDDTATIFTTRMFQAVSPSSIIVSNETKPYLLTGAFGIGGSAGLTKQGASTLTMALTNSTYTGNTTVNGGSVVVFANRPFGNTAGITVNAGGQVNLNGVTNAGVNYNWVISGNGPDGSGAIVNTNGAPATAGTMLNLTLATNASIGAYSAGLDFNARLDLCLGGTFNMGNNTLTKLGGSVLDFRGTNIGNGIIVVSNGVIYGESSNNSLGSNVVAMAGTEVGAYGGTTGLTNLCNVVLNGAYLCSMGGNNCAWNGTITIISNSYIHTQPPANSGASDIILNGRITGPAGFQKLGAQIAYMNGTNDFGGPLVVGGGTMLVSAPNVYSNSTTVANGSTLRITTGNDRLPTTTALIVNGGDTGTSLFDMNNLNQTVASLAGTNTYGGLINLGTATLTISGAGSGSYFGTITGAGTVVRSGTGIVTLNNSNRYTGGTTVNSGTLAVRHPAAVSTNPILMNGGTLSLDAAGLWEGRVAGAFNTTSNNPQWAVNVSVEHANSTVNTVYPDNTTYVYSGLLNITNNAPVTWTFVEQFDDYGLLKIDNTTLLNDGNWATPTKATVSLAPGLHTFEARFGEGTGGIGPNSGWTLGFGWDPQGRDQLVATNYSVLSDPGDGSVFRRDDFVFAQPVTANADIGLAAPVSTVPVTMAGAISGVGSVGKSGPGPLIMSGANSYGGATTISNGALFVNGSIGSAATITILSNAQLWGSGSVSGTVAALAGSVIGARIGVTNTGVTLTMPSLTLNTGAIIGGFLNGTNPTIRVTGAGALAVSASNPVQVVLNAPVAVGTYPLIAYNTSLGGSGFGGLVLATLPNGASGSLVDDGFGMVSLSITNAGAGIKWYGSTANGNWDLATTANWATLPAALPAIFQTFDVVRFDDMATNFNVAIAQPVTPASIVVSNDTQNYSFSGLSIGGIGGLTKSGAAKLTLSNGNAFKGPVLVDAGTLSVLGDSSLGTIPATTVATQLTVSAGATIEMLNSMVIPVARGVAIGPSSGSGAVTVSVASALANVTINSVIANRAGGTGQMIKTGPGMLTLTAGNTWSGGTIINSGIVAAAHASSAVGPFASGQPVTVNTGATLQMNNGDCFGYAPTAPSALNINGGTVTTITNGGNFRITMLGGGSITFNGGILTGSADNQGDFSGAYSNGLYLLNGNVVVNSNPAPAYISVPNAGMSMLQSNTTFTVSRGTNAADLVVSAKLINWNDNGNHGITKTGNGIMLMTASNTYGGATVISGGTLQIGDGVSGSLGTNTGAILNNGTLAYNLPGTFTVANAIGGTGVLVKAGSSMITLTAASTFSGGAVISNGSLIVNGAIGAGPVTAAAGTTLGGTGIVSGIVTSDGNVSPGTATTIGRLTVQGYTQTVNGALNIKVAGNAGGAGVDYDALTVNPPGGSSLAGKLNVTIVNTNYQPALNDYFFIISGSSLDGKFSETNLPWLSTGLVWNVDTTTTPGYVILSVTSAPPTGYGAWALAINNGATNYNDSAAGDGYPNLLKYATGSDPTNPAANHAQMGSAPSNGLFNLKFNRDTNAVDVTLIVEGGYSASNAADWIGFATNAHGSWGSATNIVVETPDSGSRVSVTATDPAGPATNRFLRLKVTAP